MKKFGFLALACAGLFVTTVGCEAKKPETKPAAPAAAPATPPAEAAPPAEAPK